MCEFSTKLVSWLDRELTPDQALAMERHVALCQECRERSNVYQDASRAFALYVEGVHIRQTAPSRKRGPVVLLASALAAALIALFFVVPRYPADRLPPIEIVLPRVPAMALRTSPSPSLLAVSRPRSIGRIAAPAQTWMPAQPTIEIAIPSDALFPPGAVPEGFAFVADLSLAQDGSPAELALRP
ncbi:MAG: zf-HC2 domain-containing protein [Bryobacteraceae bacterium]|jgi:hypothetical protein